MRDVVPEHHIQKKLFNKLVGASSLRYSQLKPKELEANLFMYHLKELMKMGLVEKLDGKYALTPKGQLMATRFSIREEQIRIMPSTLSVIVLRSGDEWLLYRRKRQPYIDAIGFPSGKIHLGESLKDAAERELSEKCGYGAGMVSLVHRGMFNLVDKHDNGLTNHIIGQVWAGSVTDKKVFSNHAGETFWADWHDCESEFMSGTQDLVDALASPDFFHLDLIASQG